MYCHILRVRAIPTYRVYRLYDTDSMIIMCTKFFIAIFLFVVIFVKQHYH